MCNEYPWWKRQKTKAILLMFYGTQHCLWPELWFVPDSPRPEARTSQTSLTSIFNDVHLGPLPVYHYVSMIACACVSLTVMSDVWHNFYVEYFMLYIGKKWGKNQNCGYNHLKYTVMLLQHHGERCLLSHMCELEKRRKVRQAHIIFLSLVANKTLSSQTSW